MLSLLWNDNTAHIVNDMLLNLLIYTSHTIMMYWCRMHAYITCSYYSYIFFYNPTCICSDMVILRSKICVQIHPGMKPSLTWDALHERNKRMNRQILKVKIGSSHGRFWTTLFDRWTLPYLQRSVIYWALQ